MKNLLSKTQLNNYQIYPEPQDKANWIAQDIELKANLKAMY